MQSNNIINKNEPFRNYKEVEEYLQYKQVFFKKSIANSDLQEILKGGEVHNIGKVSIKRIRTDAIAFSMEVCGKEITIYEFKDQLEFFKDVKNQFIPIVEFINTVNQNNKTLFIAGFMLGNGSHQLGKEVDIDLEFEKQIKKL